MKLRDYQIDAVNKIYDHLRTKRSNPCVSIPTGGGKTPIISKLAADVVQWGGRCLILAHVKELVLQNYNTFTEMNPELLLKTGINSAGIGRRDTEQPIIFAGIQSIYNDALAVGIFQLVIIDEAHLIPESGDGMYRTLIAEMRNYNPTLRVVGLTATPYRLGSGMVCKPENIL